MRVSGSSLVQRSRASAENENRESQATVNFAATESDCEECGARYATPGDDCTARFNKLLALDHSRQEPWGSRHGQAFSAFVLQHPRRYAASLDHAWTALYRICVDHVPGQAAFAELAAHHGVIPPHWAAVERRAYALERPSVTIADLGDFAATTYPERLDEWCRAGLAAWGCPGELLANRPEANPPVHRND